MSCVAHTARLTSAPTPLFSADKPCELYCSPLGKEAPLLVADRVLDGTPCGPYETDLCVHGRCQVTCLLCVLGGGFEEEVPPLQGTRCGAAGALGDGDPSCRLMGRPPPKLRQLQEYPSSV